MAMKETLLEQLLEPTVTALGYDFWGLEFSGRGSQTLLRVYIESDAGIQVDDCAKVSRQISAILDVEDPIPGEYTLEVSSPGLDRPLFKLEQYQRYSGQSVQVKLRLAFEGRRKFTGVLKGVEGDEVILQVEEEEFCFPIETIDQAKVQTRLDTTKSK